MQGLLLGWGGKGDENVQGSGIRNMLAAWGGQCNTGMVWGRQNYSTLSTA